MSAQIEALKQGKAIYKPIYNHDTGCKDTPELIEPNLVVVIEGTVPIYGSKARSQLDLSLYLDVADEVKVHWRMQRDLQEPGRADAEVETDGRELQPDFEAYAEHHKNNADMILRCEPSRKGLPYLKAKLIQRKDGESMMEATWR